MRLLEMQTIEGETLEVYDELDLTNPVPETVIGQHAIFLREQGIKVPFQYNGQLQKYQRPHEGSYHLQLLIEELAALQYLAARKQAPPIGNMVYFKTVITDKHLGYWWADPLGAYGYRMAPAESLPPGQFKKETLFDSGYVRGSERAWNDLDKPGNVINGYLIDFRRSGWDRLFWLGTTRPLIFYRESITAVNYEIHKLGQFPFNERKMAYQEYYINGTWAPAERSVRDRAALLHYQPNRRDTVLDIGCHTGGFLTLAALNDASRMVGLDNNAIYIDLAQRLARINGHQICYRTLDLEAVRMYDWLFKIFRDGIDHLLLLSMEKHFKGGRAFLCHLIDWLQAKRTYLETNAVKPDTPILPVEYAERNGMYIGQSTDRNTRNLYLIQR